MAFWARVLRVEHSLFLWHSRPAPHSLVICWTLVPSLSQNSQDPWSSSSPSKPEQLKCHHHLLWALDPSLSIARGQPYNWSSILQPVPYSNGPKYNSSTSLQGGFPGGSVVNNPPVNAGDMGLIPGSGRFPGEGNGHPLQYSCLGNPMNRGA